MNKHAVIIPLIGGMPIAMEHVFKRPPEYILSYTPFAANDAQYRAYRPNVPYMFIDKNEAKSFKLAPVDIVTTLCPCAGLSSLSPSAAAESTTNDWMTITAKYVLSELEPKVFWGENAPRLASKMGEPTVNRLREIAKYNGYTFSLYKTKSILHGLSQVRDRSFYFFWKGTETPILKYFRRKHETIDETILNAFVSKDDPMNMPANNRAPMDDPYYRFIRTKIYPNFTHAEIVEKQVKSINGMSLIEDNGISYDEVAKWMEQQGELKKAARCREIKVKLASGGNIMRKICEFPKDHIGAFVGHTPSQLMHPFEERFLTVRECLAIMKMPSDFQLQGGLKNLNMICQSVPVTTAADLASEILAYLNGKRDTVTTSFLVQDNKKQTSSIAPMPCVTLNEFM